MSALVLCLLLGWTGAIFDSPAGSGAFRNKPAIAPFYSRESLLGFNLPNLPPPDTGFDSDFSDIKKKSRKKHGLRGLSENTASTSKLGHGNFQNEKKRRGLQHRRWIDWPQVCGP